MLRVSSAASDAARGFDIDPRVAVVVTVYNRAHLLGDALSSVLGQTRAPQEVIVVDDGSTDDPAAVVARFPGVRLIVQENGGPSRARNAGLHATDADYVLFLDSDDVLVPTALESNLACLAENPEAGFVYGGHRRVNAALEPIGPAYYVPMTRSPYHELLHGNMIHMHGTVLYDRARLVECGGFDPEVALCEDYDTLLRMARHYPVAGNPAVVAEYRIHTQNISSDPFEMLDWALRVQKRHRPPATDLKGVHAYGLGRRWLTQTYAVEAWKKRPGLARRRRWEERWKMVRNVPLTSIAAAGWELSRRNLPPPVIRGVKRLMGRGAPGVGKVRMGDLARTSPISWHFGYDRGTPIDRHYVEAFLAQNAGNIAGRVLEIGDAAYSRQFGSGITRQDVLHVDPANKEATIIGDLSQRGVLPQDAFDCMVVTQTLHLIYDMAAAVAEMKRALRPGGVLLLTVPGVASVDRGEWGGSWFWSLTGLSTKRLFGDIFGPENIEVTVHGNVYAATCFLQGMAVEEVRRGWLDRTDPAYPMIITVQARRKD